MKAERRFISLACGFLACTLCAPALAMEVYQWTDENGVVHFSQWAPGDEVKGVETVSVDGGGQQDNGIGISETDDPQGYKEHREEMVALWAEIEARQEAERRQRERTPTTEIVYLNSEPDYSNPFFFPGRGLRPPFSRDHFDRDDDRDRRGDRERRDDGPLRSVPYKRP